MDLLKRFCPSVCRYLFPKSYDIDALRSLLDLVVLFILNGRFRSHRIASGMIFDLKIFCCVGGISVRSRELRISAFHMIQNVNNEAHSVTENVLIIYVLKSNFNFCEAYEFFNRSFLIIPLWPENSCKMLLIGVKTC